MIYILITSLITAWMVVFTRLQPVSKACKLQKHALEHQGNFFVSEIFIGVYLYYNRYCYLNYKLWLSTLIVVFLIQEMIFFHHVVQLMRMPGGDLASSDDAAASTELNNSASDCLAVIIFISGLFWVIFAQQIIMSIFLLIFSVLAYTDRISRVNDAFNHYSFAHLSSS